MYKATAKLVKNLKNVTQEGCETMGKFPYKCVPITLGPHSFVICIETYCIFLPSSTLTVIYFRSTPCVIIFPRYPYPPREDLEGE